MDQVLESQRPEGLRNYFKTNYGDIISEGPYAMDTFTHFIDGNRYWCVAEYALDQGYYYSAFWLHTKEISRIDPKSFMRIVRTKQFSCFDIHWLIDILLLLSEEFDEDEKRDLTEWATHVMDELRRILPDELKIKLFNLYIRYGTGGTEGHGGLDPDMANHMIHWIAATPRHNLDRERIFKYFIDSGYLLPSKLLVNIINAYKVYSIEEYIITYPYHVYDMTFGERTTRYSIEDPTRLVSLFFHSSIEPSPKMFEMVFVLINRVGMPSEIYPKFSEVLVRAVETLESEISTGEFEPYLQLLYLFPDPMRRFVEKYGSFLQERFPEKWMNASTLIYRSPLYPTLYKSEDFISYFSLAFRIFSSETVTSMSIMLSNGASPNALTEVDNVSFCRNRNYETLYETQRTLFTSCILSSQYKMVQLIIEHPDFIVNHFDTSILSTLFRFVYEKFSTNEAKRFRFVHLMVERGADLYFDEQSALNEWGHKNYPNGFDFKRGSVIYPNSFADSGSGYPSYPYYADSEHATLLMYSENIDPLSIPSKGPKVSQYNNYDLFDSESDSDSYSGSDSEPDFEEEEEDHRSFTDKYLHHLLRIPRSLKDIILFRLNAANSDLSIHPTSLVEYDHD